MQMSFSRGLVCQVSMISFRSQTNLPQLMRGRSSHLSSSPSLLALAYLATVLSRGDGQETGSRPPGRDASLPEDALGAKSEKWNRGLYERQQPSGW